MHDACTYASSSIHPRVRVWLGFCCSDDHEEAGTYRHFNDSSSSSRSLAHSHPTLLLLHCSHLACCSDVHEEAGTYRHFAAAIAAYTLPGMRLFHDGQLQGRKQQVSRLCLSRDRDRQAGRQAGRQEDRRTDRQTY
jgi:hypothetical protein